MKSLLRRKTLREIDLLEKVISTFDGLARVEIVEEIEFEGRVFPIHVIEFGSENPEHPVVGYFGGVHGLEKIGSEVIIAYLESISTLIKWDESFKKRLKHSRMLFMPIVNPVGIWLRRRSNAQGVDLMRNSPSEGQGKKTFYSGHRLSNKLPWYRGEAGEQMELEAKALCKVVRERLFPAKMSMAVDIHSGFGAKDRFWFPYARGQEIFPHISEVMSLVDLFNKSYPHHFYTIEPTSSQYCIDGDLWDYLVDEFFAIHPNIKANEKMFLPWTLEMGSWIWLKKNPLQILNKLGFYHPLIPHRYQRILRRHLTLFDFLHRSVLFPSPWVDINNTESKKFQLLAKEKWYA
ncbi:MAG: DUF2817 domain-containing protein [Bdellovibrionales bacterium]|nr:DUF2817 domain-containing protein [Bdellovibrionales bacterium]